MWKLYHHQYHHFNNEFKSPTFSSAEGIGSEITLFVNLDGIIFQQSSAVAEWLGPESYNPVRKTVHVRHNIRIWSETF